MDSTKRKALPTLLRLPAMVSASVIHVYQATLSPDHGPLRHLYPYGFCRHEPTCSSYALDTLKAHAYPRAVFLILRRILSCHPWSKTSNERLKKAVEKATR